MSNTAGTIQEGAGARTNHTLTLEKRKRAAISGVTDVCSFQETEIVLRLDAGLMILTGEGLHIAKLLLEEGKLDVEGHVDSIVYETPRKAGHVLWPWKRRQK